MELGGKKEKRVGDSESLLESNVAVEQVNKEVTSPLQHTSVEYLDILMKYIRDERVKFIFVTFLVCYIIWISIKVTGLSAEVESLSKESSGFSFTTLADGKKSFDIVADEIRFPRPYLFKITETVSEGVRT
jgi:hypothetical protein